MPERMILSLTIKFFAFIVSGLPARFLFPVKCTGRGEYNTYFYFNKIKNGYNYFLRAGLN